MPDVNRRVLELRKVYTLARDLRDWYFGIEAKYLGPVLIDDDVHLVFAYHGGVGIGGWIGEVFIPESQLVFDREGGLLDKSRAYRREHSLLCLGGHASRERYIELVGLMGEIF